MIKPTAYNLYEAKTDLNEAIEAIENIAYLLPENTESIVKTLLYKLALVQNEIDEYEEVQAIQTKRFENAALSLGYLKES